MTDDATHGQRSASNPAFAYRLACDTVYLGFLFCVVPVIVQNVLYPAGSEYPGMAVALIMVAIPGNAFFLFIFDKWTPRVFIALLPVVLITVMCNITMLLVTFLHAGVFGIEAFTATGNIVLLLCNFACASAARSTRENILLFWDIKPSNNEKPATYVALVLVAMMIAACVIEWRLVYPIASSLVLTIPLVISRVQRDMRTRASVDPGIEKRHVEAYTAPVFTRSAATHVLEKAFLAFLFTFPLAGMFSSPMFRACIDVLIPGGSLQPLSSTFLLYILAFFALGSPFLVLSWWLSRRFHSDPFMREKAAIVCAFFATCAMLTSFTVDMFPDSLPPLAYIAWSVVNNAFFSMEMLYIFLVLYDLLPSKRTVFFGQFLPIVLVTTFFLWIFPIADSLSTTTTFVVPGIASAVVLLVYYWIQLRVRKKVVARGARVR